MTTATKKPQITALAPWFGSNRMLAADVGKLLTGCAWVGVPFAGGMSELVHIAARTLAVNDLHRHVINLARSVAHPQHGPALYRRLRRKILHPDELAESQFIAQTYLVWDQTQPNIDAAEAYFAAVWMGRNGKAGTEDEFKGGLAFRWDAGGGDSATRYRNAVASLREWRRLLSRCQFSCQDAFKFLDLCPDRPGCGIYCDPPFPGPGDAYRHTFSEADHRALATILLCYSHARVVCRFYDVPLIRSLYPENFWSWRPLVGRKATNEAAPEVLLVREGKPA